MKTKTTKVNDLIVEEGIIDCKYCYRISKENGDLFLSLSVVSDYKINRNIVEHFYKGWSFYYELNNGQSDSNGMYNLNSMNTLILFKDNNNITFFSL